MRAVVAFFVLSVGAACTPDIGNDPVPAAMEFDTATGRIPEPTHILFNPVTRHLDFSVVGISVPANCAMPGTFTQAQCEFYQYLQSLTGYPTVTGGRAPADAPLDPATLTAKNVVVVDVLASKLVPDVVVGFDAASRYVTLAPRTGWDTGRLYVVGIRGYHDGVKTADGREVVSSVPYYLLKQDSSLTCDATTAPAISEACPPYQLLAQQMDPAATRATLLQLETLRGSYNVFRTTELLAMVGGIPKDELAVYWAFSTHASPVAELNPGTGAVPRITGDREIAVAVKGTIDPGTLKATRAGMPATVTLLDLTAAANADLIAGMPPFAVTYEGGAIVIRTTQPLTAGHQYGVFFSKAIATPDGTTMVASPVSFLLTARGKMVNDAGKSQVSALGDAEAAILEEGRAGLVDLFDNPLIQAITGLERANAAYVYAFTYGAAK